MKSDELWAIGVYSDFLGNHILHTTSLSNHQSFLPLFLSFTIIP